MFATTNPIYYQLNNPYLLSTKLDIEEDVRIRMVKQIIDQIDKAEYHGGYTFEVMDSKIYRDFSKLYNKFLDISREIFGPFDLSTKHKHWCWANVYNKDSFRTNLHTHELTSTINGVFYLNVPKDIGPEEGGLLIAYEDQENIFLPDNCELVIMPSWMGHGPQPHSSTENRIAINMEICAVEDVQDLYTVDKVYKKCQAQMQ